MKAKKGIDRTATSYGDSGFSSFLRKAFLASAGYDSIDLDRLVIGIVNTSSDFTTCHRHMPEIIEAVKRGVLEAGGLPLVFPTISLGEILISPTSMLYRNLLAMETEEMIKAYPMDAVVLVGGCDKTIPAQLMAAASANVPAICEVTGPMHTGFYNNQPIGACTDCRRYWAMYRSGSISKKELLTVQNSLCPTGGTCMVMGTASTMASIAETMGMMIPGGATPLSGSGERLQHAVATGRQAVALAERQGPKPLDILTHEAFTNGLTVFSALGGSTNAIIHLCALARRCGVLLPLETFHQISHTIPLCVNCKPTGTYYMEDFHRAGGVKALLTVLKHTLCLEAKTVTGQTLGTLLKHFPPLAPWQNIISYDTTKPADTSAVAILNGNLAPNGAVIKTAAASKSLLHHRGPAAVFEYSENLVRSIDDKKLALTPDHVLVLRNAGPKSAGMPEVGSLPIPQYLAKKGVTDMVRISDARMSGTAFGTVVLHCAPEAAVGGSLSLVKNGDIIELNCDKREVNVLVSKEELQKRKKIWQPAPLPKRGWPRLHAEHVMQADQGADLDFL